jgi:hypothetical protein
MVSTTQKEKRPKLRVDVGKIYKIWNVRNGAENNLAPSPAVLFSTAVRETEDAALRKVLVVHYKYSGTQRQMVNGVNGWGVLLCTERK